jgi:hypothetical protein
MGAYIVNAQFCLPVEPTRTLPPGPFTVPEDPARCPPGARPPQDAENQDQEPQGLTRTLSML